jgi:hypothetical protein
MTPFVLSSFEVAPEHFLLGHCWAGSDLVVGDQGYQQYRKEKSRDIEPGEDGAYVVVKRSGQNLSIGTDCCGYAKLFLYRYADTWAVSNSFYTLAEFVGSRGLPLTLCEAQFRAFMISGHFGQQLISVNTAAREISFIPSRCKVEVVNNSVTLAHTAAAEAMDEEAPVTDYASALEKWIGTWIGRFNTMFASDVEIFVDLSGGRDSRAVLGLALLARRSLNIPADRFYVRSSVRKKDDFRIAQAIAQKFRLDVNRETSKNTKGDQGSYRLWKDHALGVYSPFYLFEVGMWRFSLTGGGGESHRPFYPEPGIDATFRKLLIDDGYWARGARLLGALSRPILYRRNPEYEILRREVHNSIAAVRWGYEAQLDEMVVHYRHFRDRFHFGFGAVDRSNVSPLASKFLRFASARCDPTRFRNSNVIGDVIAACDRELATMPFDKSSKRINLDDIPVMPRNFMQHADLGGRRYGDAGTRNTSTVAVSSRFAELVKEFEESEERVRATGLLPTRYLDRAKRTADRMARTGKRDKADYHATRLTHVILAGELLRLSRR